MTLNEKDTKLFTLAVEVSQDGIVIGDANTGKITYVNDSIMRMLGYTNREDVIGKCILDFVADTDKEKAIKHSVECVNTHQGWKDQFTVTKLNGELLKVELTATPIKNENGDQIAFINIVRDVSDRTKTEESLKEARQKLQLANDKLLVVGGLVRHDIGNKISSLNANAYLARKKGSLEQLLDATSATYLQICRTLEFSREYELLGQEPQSFLDVGQVFNEAVKLFPESKLQIINQCEGVMVLADSLLKEAFYNLLDDTLKYGKTARQVKLFFSQQDTQLKLVYEDDGQGIPDEMKPNLFTKGYGQGSGLGLYLIKKTLEVYGWQITETGQAGKNARFEITIPQNNYKINNF
ncbi:MAG: PAS domain-containing protein [Candidatus Bathyarchaeia archaeon]